MKRRSLLSAKQEVFSFPLGSLLFRVVVIASGFLIGYEYGFLG